MTKSSNLYVGMDVHKDSVDIALADGDGRQEVRHYGREILGPGTFDAIETPVRAKSRAGAATAIWASRV